MNQAPDHNIINDVLSASEELIIKDKKLFTDLSAYLNELIVHDFERLIFLLYGIDVNEKKIKTILQQEPGTNAGETIATLIIERQLQKIKSRQENRRNKNDINNEDEDW